MPTYHDQTNAQNTLKLRELLKELPLFVRSYFGTLGDQTQPRTRLGYAYDLKIFFGFLSEEVFDGTPPKEIDISQMARLESDHIEAFMEYLTYYIPAGEVDLSHQNHALGKSRKLAAVRGLFKHLYMKKKLPANPAELVAFPKIHQKTITTLKWMK